MKKFLILIPVVFCFFMISTVFAEETLLFVSTGDYLGGCQLTDESQWKLTKNLEVTKFEIWYYWNEGETSIPVTVFKDGQEFAKFEATRGDCDVYQKQWCNADYAINKTFPKGNYSTKIEEARQCLKPGGTGTVRLYGSEATSAATEEVAEEETPKVLDESIVNCTGSCTKSIVITSIVTLFISFLIFTFIFKKK